MSLAFSRRRDKHAIGEFVATIQLFQSVNPTTLVNVVAVLRQTAIELNLPAPMPIQHFQFGFGPSPADIAPMFQPPMVSGFQRFAGDGEIEESLICDGQSITYTLRNYTNWSEVKPRIVSTFNSLLQVYALEVPAIQSVRLQYLNEFRGSSTSVHSASELFKPGCRWVAPFVSQAIDSWHSYVGYFVPVDANQKNLVNVNCDITEAMFPPDNLPVLYAKVLILAGCYFNVPGGAPLIMDLENIEAVLNETFEKAHSLEKEILREVVADPYLVDIGANNAN